MGKKSTSFEQATSLVSTIPINKKKSLSTNLNRLIKQLKEKHSVLSTKQYLSLLHRFISRCTKSDIKMTQQTIVKNTLKIKICK